MLKDVMKKYSVTHDSTGWMVMLKWEIFKLHLEICEVFIPPPHVYFYCM